MSLFGSADTDDVEGAPQWWFAVGVARTYVLLSDTGRDRLKRL